MTYINTTLCFPLNLFTIQAWNAWAVISNPIRNEIQPFYFLHLPSSTILSGACLYFEHGGCTEWIHGARTHAHPFPTPAPRFFKPSHPRSAREDTVSTILTLITIFPFFKTIDKKTPPHSHPIPPNHQPQTRFPYPDPHVLRTPLPHPNPSPRLRTQYPKSKGSYIPPPAHSRRKARQAIPAKNRTTKNKKNKALAPPLPPCAQKLPSSTRMVVQVEMVHGEP